MLVGRDKLRQACRGRLQYRDWPIGTAAAGGLPRHLFRSEEGTTMIYRLGSEAQRAIVCFLGHHEDWRSDDLRICVGVALVAAGAHVVHLNLVAHESRPTCSLDVQSEEHPKDFDLPLRLQPPPGTPKPPVELPVDG